MTRRRLGPFFWGTPINDVSGRLFRFYGVTLGRVGLGVITHPARLSKEDTDDRP